VYEHRKEGDVFLIRDPNVSLDQVEAMQQEVIDLLENSAAPPSVDDSGDNIVTEEVVAQDKQPVQ
jgi:hypothetical protein